MVVEEVVTAENEFATSETVVEANSLPVQDSIYEIEADDDEGESSANQMSNDGEVTSLTELQKK